MHAAAVHANHWLGQEAGSVAHSGSHLTADQFVELNVVGGSHYFGVAVIDFKLGRSYFGVIFFILKAHGALHFRALIDERTQRITWEGMIISTGVDVFEPMVFMEMAFSVPYP